MNLTIVIPAYNEEEAIASICERSLAARAEIIAKTNVVAVNIIVVSDGSHDKTPEIAATFNEIKLIAYPKNKGYGAAIKMGFEATNDELVSFLDADGTCNPLFFVDLINEMEAHNYDVMLGSRMGKDSHMPTVRRVGNVLFATLMNTLSGSKVKDTASGMRVIKRSALAKLYPLPDGLHFTPAMSAKALFHQELTIGELPMSYKERIGESKLNPIKDGIRFLRVIIETAIQFKPNLFFNVFGVTLLGIAALLSMPVFLHLFNGQMLDNGMIYRSITAFGLANAGLVLLTTGQVAKSFLSLIHYQKEAFVFKQRFSLNSIFVKHGLLLGLFALIIAGGILYTPLIELYKTGSIATPWWTFLFGQLVFLMSFIFMAAGAMGVVVRLVSVALVQKEALR